MAGSVGRSRPGAGRARAIVVLVVAPLIVLLGVIAVGVYLDARASGGTPGAAESRPGSATTASSSPSATDRPPDLAEAEPYDDATWCSPERGDCVRVELPRVEGFGGASLVTRMPVAVDADGCSRALAADFWLWYCPAGAVVDTETFAPVDHQDAELERLYIKFKNLEGWRYLRAE